jgi:hypothetical protein
MGAIKQRVLAKLMKSGDRVILLMDEKTDPVYLAYALVERETDVEIFPESLLDDWGHEISSLNLYDWIQENGLQFPRAEVFGSDKTGIRKQCFLRELDLVIRYPCYVYNSKSAPLNEGRRLEAILIPDQKLIEPKRIKPPDVIPKPMLNADVSWWRVPATNLDNIDIHLFTPPQD